MLREERSNTSFDWGSVRKIFLIDIVRKLLRKERKEPNTLRMRKN